MTPPNCLRRGAVDADPTAGWQGVQYGARGCAASHSRARRWASAISSGVIRPAAGSRLLTTRSRSSPVDREAARLNHMCACTSSCGTPRPLEYLTPRLNCASASPRARPVRPSGRRGITGPGLLYRYESYDLATRIVFKQKIDVAIECLFDIAYSTDAFEQRFPRHEFVVFDLDSKQAARLQ